jgi:hypothetical protein
MLNVGAWVRARANAMAAPWPCTVPVGCVQYGTATCTLDIRPNDTGLAATAGPSARGPAAAQACTLPRSGPREQLVDAVRAVNSTCPPYRYRYVDGMRESPAGTRTSLRAREVRGE